MRRLLNVISCVLYLPYVSKFTVVWIFSSGCYDFRFPFYKKEGGEHCILISDVQLFLYKYA
jgi:hypothetical protein